MRILIVEDDQSLHRIILRRLKEEGYMVDGCYDGEDGLYYMTNEEYDCIILDWMLPKKDGVIVLREFRNLGHETPVLMLTAKDSIMDRVVGLDAGADDYLTKPFAFDELLARIRALLRRHNNVKENKLQLGDLVMDLPKHTVHRGDKEIHLTSKEYALLQYFLSNQEQVLTRSQIADHVWDYDFDYDSNVVDVYVRYLRNKIDKGFDVPLIHTVRGYGYVMKLGDGDK
jgi:heavy metal response regulator